MKIRIILKIVVLLVASTSMTFAQTTSPLPVDLSYHFKPGTVLHYKKVDEFRNPENPPGFGEGNWDRIEDIHITVEKIDSIGNATLVVHNEETHDFKGGDDADGVTQGGLTADVPLYRVKVDHFGKFLDGEILRRTTTDSIFHEKLKNPNFNGWAASDSTIIKRAFQQVLSPRPTRTKVQIGMKWNDSTHEVSRPQTIPLNHSASTSPKTPAGPNYNSNRHDYHIDQSAEDRIANRYILSTTNTNYQVVDGSLISQGTSEEKQIIQSTNGLTISRTSAGHRIGGMGLNKSFSNRTLTLISIDSTQK